MFGIGLRMNAEATDLIEEDGRIVPLRAKTADGTFMTPVLLAVAAHDGWVFPPMADALAKDRGDDTIGLPLHQLGTAKQAGTGR